MNKILLNLLVLLLSTGLVACASNSQQTNTTLGAVTGAVVGGAAGSLIGQGTGQAIAIGAGAVAGALIGGYAGHNMDSSDNRRMYRAMDYTPTNKTKTWTNKKTRTTYSVKPTSGMLNVKGNPNCRKFMTSGSMNGKASEEMHGIACRQTDGTWKAIS